MTTVKNMYERLRPLILWLGLIELAWIADWLLSANNATPQYTTAIVFWVALLLVWMVAVVIAGSRGVFLKHSKWFSNMIGIAAIITFSVALFGLLPTMREGLLSAAQSTSDFQLISIHILRLLSIGTLIKYIHRELPLYFVILGFLPDFLFAVSAVILVALGAYGSLGQSFYIAWHLIGASVFLGAGISMFFSVPSLLRISHKTPDTSIVFRFPMLLAPNFTVPLFMLAHVFALIKLFTT